MYRGGDDVILLCTVRNAKKKKEKKKNCIFISRPAAVESEDVADADCAETTAAAAAKSESNTRGTCSDREGNSIIIRFRGNGDAHVSMAKALFPLSCRHFFISPSPPTTPPLHIYIHIYIYLYGNTYNNNNNAVMTFVAAKTIAPPRAEIRRNFPQGGGGGFDIFSKYFTYFTRPLAADSLVHDLFSTSRIVCAFIISEFIRGVRED